MRCTLPVVTWRFLVGLLAVTACRDVAARGDAAPGAPDATLVDAGPGEVALTVYLPDAPGQVAAMRPVVFSLPDGTLLEGETNAAGVVRAVVPVGTAATIALTSASLLTVLGLEPGAYVVGVAERPGAADLVVPVSLPAPLNAGGRLLGPCAETAVAPGGSDGLLVVPARCRPTGLSTLLAIADGATWSALPDQVLAAAPPVAVPAPTAAPTSITLDATTVPADVTTLTVAAVARTAGRRLGLDALASAGPVAATRHTVVQVPVPNVGDVRLRTTLTAVDGGVRSIAQRAPGASVALDGATLVPALTALALAPGEVRWTVGAGAFASLATADLTFTPAAAPDAPVRWRLLGPAGTSLGLPTLPAAWGALHPAAGDLADVRVELIAGGTLAHAAAATGSDWEFAADTAQRSVQTAAGVTVAP